MKLPEPFPLYGKEFKRDPYPAYQRMREQGPVHRVKFPSGVIGWLVTGYRAAHQALSDSRLRKNHRYGNDAWRKLAAIMPEPQHSQLQVHLLHQDPPKHTDMRRLVTDALTPRRIDELRPRMQQIADELLDEMPDTGSFDVVRCFAARFPFLALSEVIGLPAEYQRRFKREWCKVVQPVGPRDPQRPTYVRRLSELQGYIDDVTAHKRAHPADDLLSRLVTAHDDGRLSGEELASMVFQLLVAGQEPVTNQITTSLVALLRHPDHLRKLAENPDLLPAAVEELLRYDGAFELTTWRFFAEDTDLHGTTVPAGDSVIISLDAANRDPERFSCPAALDFDRSPNPHLSFGHGIHFCPGAALARVELSIALGTLLRRLPGMRLAIPDEQLEWIPAVLARGVDHLPLTFDR